MNILMAPMVTWYINGTFMLRIQLLTLWCGNYSYWQKTTAETFSREQYTLLLIYTCMM